jgi:hypothetical protein
MRNIFVIPAIFVLCLQIEISAAENAPIKCNMVVEKVYADNTRICYFETNRVFSPQSKDFLKTEVEKNSAVKMFSFFKGEDKTFMFHSAVNFTLDSVAKVINNILSENPQPDYTPPSRPQKALSHDICASITPGCTEQKYNYVAETEEFGYGSIGCLANTYNPSLFYMQISEAGDMDIEISSKNNDNEGRDVDFICWGPYSSLSNACSDVSLVKCDDCPPKHSDYPFRNIADCSFSNSAIDTCRIRNAQVGDIYILLVTNFSRQQSNISLVALSEAGNAQTDCSIVTMPVVNNGPLCKGAMLQLSANYTLPNATYSWTGPNGFTSTDRNPVRLNMTAADAGVYTVTIKVGTQTKAVTSTTVEVIEPVFFEYSDTICRGGRYFFNNDYRTETGKYVKTTRSVITGCDSIVTLNLAVDSCYADINPLHEICGDDANFDVKYNNYRTADCISIIFSQKSKDAGFNDVAPCEALTGNLVVPIPQNVRPGHYSANIIFDYNDDSQIIKLFDFDVLYPKTIIKQKWNNVLALQNSSYNGGYEFSVYEWYQNNRKLEGEEGSYIHLGEGNMLDFVSEYRAKLTRTDDNEATFTCAFIPEMHTDVSFIPTLVNTHESLPIKASNNGTITFLSVSGMAISKQTLSEGDNYVQTPMETGFYIIVIEEENIPTVRKQIMLVK